MNEVIWRFPHLIESIFGRIDSESLVKCRVVGELWCNHLGAQKFFKIRMIQATVEQFHEISNAWTRIFKTATTQTILDLGEAVQNFYQRSSVLKYQNGIAPLHVAAATGNLWLFREIYAKALDKYPRDNEGWTILHFPAQNGHLHVYDYISNKCYDQNPRDNTGWTPLHSAAAKGHLNTGGPRLVLFLGPQQTALLEKPH